MGNRLVGAVSPYLRSHADNPVDWWAWGAEPFAEAAKRDVPVLISIGYSTCHWCHVMARESFTDPELAAYLNDNFVSIKVDREEHPEVDTSYLAAASAFTGNLGWPLTVFADPQGRAFFAGTYFPPEPADRHPSFKQILDAVLEAWRDRRDRVEQNAAAIAQAVGAQELHADGDLPDRADLQAVVGKLKQAEDEFFGGFGPGPKFPLATVLLFLQDLGVQADADALALAERTLRVMAASDLRDPVEGGFFRYAVRRDWTEPHYERMLYDNALLLRAYARAGDREVADGIAGFLLDVLRLPDGAFASAQDSESVVDGRRTEGGYYALDAEARARQQPPAIDDKVLAGWNGLAIEALAEAGELLGRQDWIEAAQRAADRVVQAHYGAGVLIRAVGPEGASAAAATLEDYGMLAAGLLRVAIATGEARHAATARELIDAVIDAGDPFGVPGGGDPVLASAGMTIRFDPNEGALPSGLSATASAALRLHALTGERRYRESARQAMALLGRAPVENPTSFGSALSNLVALDREPEQLVVVSEHPDAEIASIAHRWQRGVAAVVTERQAQDFEAHGFELFAGRVAFDGRATAYHCHDFVCRLPVTDAGELTRALSE